MNILEAIDLLIKKKHEKRNEALVTAKKRVP